MVGDPMLHGWLQKSHRDALRVPYRIGEFGPSVWIEKYDRAEWRFVCWCDTVEEAIEAIRSKLPVEPTAHQP